MPWSALEAGRLAVWGAGREGLAALHALRRRWPARPLALIAGGGEAAALRDRLDAGIEIVTAAPDADVLAQYDWIIKSPGISLYRPEIAAARARGVRFTSGSALWFAAHPEARTIAVTGTKGKSTTTALIAHLLRAAGLRVALAGNIGVPLLDLLDPPQAPDWWVIELSSFQTADLDAVPEIAVMLNLYPEHLDWHGDTAHYYADKLRLLGGGERHPRVSVMNALQAWPAGFVAPDGTAWFGDARGIHVFDDRIIDADGPIVELAASPLPGEHNALNLCAALAAVAAAGIDPRAVAASVSTFRALPHRLQVLGERDGVTWVDDSIATTPHATLAALRHHRDQATVVLVGGFDRGVPWDDFARAIVAAPPAGLICFGAAGPRIAAALIAAGIAGVDQPDTLADAVLRARARVPAGGVILLSPGSPSFDAYCDYVARGRHFAELGGFDPDEMATIAGLGILDPAPAANPESAP
jgi:UDP-N-acetylmuramoylalanine--D-glutamate ligase